MIYTTDVQSLYQPITQGFLLGGSLIIAIGAQNAFILRQGLLRQHVFVLCLICAISDSLLIAAGVAGLGSIISSNPTWLKYAAWGGAIFLTYYGLRSFIAALKNNSLKADVSKNAKTANLAKSLLIVLTFTWANPHVYLDTVVLIGSIAGQYEDDLRRASFGFGAIMASFVWFFTLGYGARFLRPIFANPTAWVILDISIAFIMWGIAFFLIKPMVF
jgi:L-lysine exporter family protein LysE/ArgO